MLHGHGDDGYRYAKEVKADFSTNVWYGGEPKGLKEHLLSHWEIVNRYPEAIGESLSEKIANHFDLASENILVNNGSTESIYLISQAWQQSSSEIVTPSFAEYEDSCKLYKHSIKFVSWDDLHSELRVKADLFFICNPNNPTGAVFLGLERLLENNPKTTFIIDEAFIDFTDAIESIVGLVKNFKNLVVLHSLTKTYAIPGLRLGYIVAHPEIIAKLKAFKFPWSINALALEAGHFIFDNFQNIQIPLEHLLKDKKNFVHSLADLPVNITQSHTHFFLGEILDGTASDLKRSLLENHGLLIRDASNFKGLNSRHFRLATLSPDKNQLLIEALRLWKNR
ncbi:MAG: pyridoxal phosphate-dependent class II aminotransferase [Opitutaceae bacterium]|nr:pyridoxal phosphate-dependent class II aminotransferase [Cytophagales bacterium]